MDDRSSPDDIVPDDADWTWVLERRCPECGFDAPSLDPATVGGLVRANAAAWAEVLGEDDRWLRTRPRPDRWSPLEYACHVRDVFRIFEGRLERMLTEDDPHYENWDQDATAVADRYREQDPGDVAPELAAAAATLAAAFEGVAGDQWHRAGHRSDGASFTVDSLVRYFAHDPVHHLWDVREGSAA